MNLSQHPLVSPVHHLAVQAVAAIATGGALILCGCASTAANTASSTTPRIASAPCVGSWTSELDGSTLTLEPTGIFGVHSPARASRPASSAVGRWVLNGAQIMLLYAASGDASGSASLNASVDACGDMAGIYTCEVVRDSMRFDVVKDECVARHTLMAWPFKRASVAASR